MGIESKEQNYDGDGNREWGTKLWWWWEIWNKERETKLV
jgi:hypothetical protein